MYRFKLSKSGRRDKPVTKTLCSIADPNAPFNYVEAYKMRYNKSVCLVECDLRRPTVHRFIDSHRNSHGLTNILKGQVEINSVLHKVSGTKMSILLAGSIPPNPSELLASPNMRTLVADLEEKFDYVIYDTPPVFLVTDAAALGKYMDGAIFVIKHNSTDKGIVVQATKNLEAAGVNILGAIYSNYNNKSAGSYSKYSRYNYYEYYTSDHNEEKETEI